MRGLFSKTNNRSITMESALLRLSEAAEFTGLSKDQINHRVYRHDPPSFPLPVRIGGRSIAWRRRDLKEWLDALEPARNAA